MPDHIRDTDTPQDTTPRLAERLIAKLRQEHGRTVPQSPLVERILKTEGLPLKNVDAEVLTDLVYAEWVLRIERGDSLSRDEYRSRFPRIAQRLEKQWSLDESLEELSTDPRLAATVSPMSAGETQAVQQGAVTDCDYIGKYKVISRLGAGGQAEIYRALHPTLQRDVVIKLLNPPWLATPGITFSPQPVGLSNRILEEGRLLAQLSHPNVAQVYDIDQMQDRPFLVMEYVEGLALDQFHRTHPLDMKGIARLMASVVRAVAAAHSRGIIHLDIKPQNIVVENDGSPKLIDFGLSRLADAWNPSVPIPGVSGTIAFMSPEQARGDTVQVGPASDIFALGATLYYLLTRQPPYQSTDSTCDFGTLAVLERVRHCEWDRQALVAPHIPGAMVEICLQAMSLDPASRFATASQMAHGLETFAAQSRRTLRVVAAAAMLVTVATGTWFWRSNFTGPANGILMTTAILPPHSIGNDSQLPHKVDLMVFVDRNAAQLHLTDAVPLFGGDYLSIECRIPAGIALMLFSINGDGKLLHVASQTSASVERQWRYPEDVASAVPLTGPIGTECLLVIGFRDTSASVEHVQAAWDDSMNWPALPPATVLRLRGAKVIAEQVDRDLGMPRRNANRPADQITRTLERFADRIMSQCPLLEGVVFSHVTATE